MKDHHSPIDSSYDWLKCLEPEEEFSALWNELSEIIDQFKKSRYWYDLQFNFIQYPLLPNHKLLLTI